MTDTTTPTSSRPLQVAGDEEPPNPRQVELADLADRYVLKSMTDEEREQFELRLMDDEDALLQVELALALSEGLVAHAAPPATALKPGPQMPAAPSPGPQTANVALPWTLAIAASLMCVALLLQRPAAVSGAARDAYTVDRQVVLGGRYRSADGGLTPVSVTPPPTGTVLFEIRLPREIANAVPPGKGVKAQLTSREDGRILLETQATVLSGYALIGIGADHLLPGLYDVTVEAPEGGLSEAYPILVPQPGDDA